MDGQPAAVLVVRLFTQEIEKLGVDQRDQEVKGAVGVRHDEEQRRLPVSQRVQLQLVIGRDVPQFLDVKGRQSGTAGNQDGFGGLVLSCPLITSSFSCAIFSDMFCCLLSNGVSRLHSTRDLQTMSLFVFAKLILPDQNLDKIMSPSPYPQFLIHPRNIGRHPIACTLRWRPFVSPGDGTVTSSRNPLCC